MTGGGSERHVVLALDFGGSKIAAAVAGLDGSIHERDVIETVPSDGALPNLERAVQLGRRLAAGRAVVAVGACTFGIPRPSGVELAPAVPGWDRLALEQELSDAFEAPVRVLNDVKAAAFAELRDGALAGADPGIYLNLGTGLAIAITSGGQVIGGAHGAAGEIGYSLRNPGTGARDDDGRQADDNALVVEEVVSGMGLAGAVAAEAHPAVSGVQLFELAAQGDERYRPIAERFVRELCFHLVNLAIALDPERVAVGGGLTSAWAHLEPELRRSLDEHVPYPPELVLGAYPTDASLWGAVAAGVQLANEIRTEDRIIPIPTTSGATNA